jgi:hypothetical protein
VNHGATSKGQRATAFQAQRDHLQQKNLTSGFGRFIDRSAPARAVAGGELAGGTGAVTDGVVAGEERAGGAGVVADGVIAGGERGSLNSGASVRNEEVPMRRVRRSRCARKPAGFRRDLVDYGGLSHSLALPLAWTLGQLAPEW